MGTSSNATELTEMVLAMNSFSAGTTVVAPTSSGMYFTVGDAGKAILLVMNGSSDVDVYGWVEPSTYNSFSRGTNGVVSSAISSGSGDAAALTFVCTVCSTWHTATTNLDCMKFAVVGPFETGRYKSSDGHIFIHMSTDNSTYCGVTVIGLPGSST